MTNYERIKNMSIDEMANEINHIGNVPCYPCNDRRCTGSIAVKLYNHSGMDYSVCRGDKISQLVVVKIDTPELVLVDKLADTERGNGGFGSTGR